MANKHSWLKLLAVVQRQINVLFACVCAWIERTRRKDGISKMGCDVGTRRGEQIASIINLCVCGEQWPA